MPTAEEITLAVRRGVPLAGAMGVEVLSAAGGAATVRLPRSALVLRPGDTVSGPAIMALADVAFWAAWLGTGGGTEDALTTSLTVNFLRRAGPGPLLAEARLLKRGRTLVFGEVLVRAEGADDLAAHVTTSWAVSRSVSAAGPQAA